MNGNRIRMGAQLECKGMRRPFEDTVWTGVGRGQWGLVRWGTSSSGRASSTAHHCQSCDDFSISLGNPVPRLGGTYVADSHIKLDPDYYEWVVPH
jgi:hypothetical protein